MKKEVTPTMIFIGAVIAVIVLGGLYYRFIRDNPNEKSEVASPYGLPKPGEGFKTPPSEGSGRNTITGEPLPPGASHPVMNAPGSPTLPPGVNSQPGSK